MLGFEKCGLANVDELKSGDERANQIYSEIDEITILGSMVIIKKSYDRSVEKTILAFERQIRRLRMARDDSLILSKTKELVNSDPNEKLSYALIRFAHYLATYDEKNERALELVDEGMQLAKEWLYGERVKSLILQNLGVRTLYAKWKKALRLTATIQSFR